MKSDPTPPTLRPHRFDLLSPGTSGFGYQPSGWMRLPWVHPWNWEDWQLLICWLFLGLALAWVICGAGSQLCLLAPPKKTAAVSMESLSLLVLCQLFWVDVGGGTRGGTRELRVGLVLFRCWGGCLAWTCWGGWWNFSWLWGFWNHFSGGGCFGGVVEVGGW